MNTVRRWIRDVFGFSGTEINGFVILIPLMLLFVFSQPAYHGWRASRAGPGERDSLQLDSLIQRWQASGQQAAVVSHFDRFQFDPNHADLTALKKLGFTDILAKRITAYRSKGGVFRIKSDLLKIYGLDSALYKQLYSHISLPETSSTADGNRTKKIIKGRSHKKKEKPIFDIIIAFDINTADTLQLKSVYGIGSILAVRLIKFRDRLGGFVSPEQLYEVYGLDSLTVKELQQASFIKKDFVPDKVNINTADEKMLSRHPYIRFRLARRLVSHRFQHGDFLQASDIKKLSSVTPEEMERLLPYIKVKD